MEVGLTGCGFTFGGSVLRGVERFKLAGAS